MNTRRVTLTAALQQSPTGLTVDEVSALTGLSRAGAKSALNGLSLRLALWEDGDRFKLLRDADFARFETRGAGHDA